MINIYKLLSSDLVILAVGKLLQMLLLFVAVKLFTTYLSDNEIGNLILIVSAASFFGMAAINPVGSLINRRLNDWKEQGTIYVNFILFNYYVVIVSVIAFFTPYLLYVVGVGSTVNTLYFSVSLSLFVYFNTWNQTVIPSLNLLYYRKIFVLLTLISSSSYIVLSSGIIHLHEATAVSWFIGQTLGVAIGFILSLVYLFKKIINKEKKFLPKIKWSEISKVSRFSLPLAAATILFWLLGNSYKIIIEGVFSAKDLAYIGLALSLATSLAGSIESLLMQVYHAPFYSGLAQCKTRVERARFFQIFINNTIPIVGLVIFVLIVIAPFLLSILAESRFLSAYTFLMSGLLIEFLRVSTNIISHAAHSEYKTHKNINPYFWGAIISTLSIFIVTFSGHWQLLVVVSLIVSWLITLVLMVKSSKKLLDFYFPWKELIQMLLYGLPVILIASVMWGRANVLAVSLAMICVTGLYLSVVIFHRYKSRGGDV